MKSVNRIRGKLFAFVDRVMDSYGYLVTNREEFILSEQFLRSGTSIGANMEKSITFMDAKEIKYGFRSPDLKNYLSRNKTKSLLIDTVELYKMTSSILISSKTVNAI